MSLLTCVILDTHLLACAVSSMRLGSTAAQSTDTLAQHPRAQPARRPSLPKAPSSSSSHWIGFVTTHRYTLMCPVAGVELHVWCAGMRTGNPREFITLGSEGNSANYMCGPSCRQRHPTSATVITKCVVCRTLSTSFKSMIVFSCNSHSVVFDDSAIKRWFFMQLIGPFFFSQSTSLNILMMRMILTSFA